MDELKLKKYANLLVKAGGNVQKGQFVVISCKTDDAYFGRLVQEAAYDAGAEEVRIDWTDDVASRTTFLKADDKIFDSFPKWRVDKLQEQDERGAVYLAIISQDPDMFKGVDPSRLSRSTKVSRENTKEHTKRMMSNENRWSIVAVPSPAWAKKVFPNLDEKEAVSKLWGLVVKAARADGDNPIADWEIHKANFAKNVEYLNNKQFDSLRFNNSLGTDFTLGLVKNHVWVGGGDVGKDGIPFFPNIPTEEIFTMPDKNRCTGKVVASMPLSYQGSLIEGFEFEFKDGMVVNYSAKTGQENLKTIMDMDEGAKRLGEVALVSNSSPIGQMKTLFYNTLYDENASSHLALGRAYPTNMKDGEKLSPEDFAKAGGNDSLIHVDFMFGTSDMCVYGIDANGAETLFFKDGEFVV